MSSEIEPIFEEPEMDKPADLWDAVDALRAMAVETEQPAFPAERGAVEREISENQPAGFASTSEHGRGAAASGFKLLHLGCVR